MKIRFKVFFIVFFIAFIPMVIIFGIANRQYQKAAYERMDEISSNIFQNAVYKLNDTIDTIRNTAELFTFYSANEFSIIENLKQFSDPDAEYSSHQILKANQNISFACQNVLYSYDYFYGLYVITPSGVVLGHQTGINGDIPADYVPFSQKWYQDTLDLDGGLYISSAASHRMFSGKKESIFFARSLRDIYTHEFLGVAVIDCNPEIFDFSHINALSEASLFTLTDTATGAALYSNAESISSAFTGIKAKTYTASLNLDTLQFSAVFDYGLLEDNFNYTGFILIPMILLCSLGIIVNFIFLSQNMVKPIESLSTIMAGSETRRQPVSSNHLKRTDEIGILYNEYNNMIEELNATIKRDYQNKLIALDSQMKSLEARINSHFLFNTLESINSIAEIENNELISEMSSALGNMFRYSIKTQSELVTIEDELNHVYDYVSIQRIRFDNKFSLNIQVPEELTQIKILKLILQPLVENAFYHGLNYCTAGDFIRITGRIEDQCILLNVIDNGKGMTKESLEKIQRQLLEEANFTALGHRTKESMGLKNIHTRLELYYGRGYGLTICSKEGSGTRIQIKIPVLDKEEI